MAERPTILCPIDFSDPSRWALRYAAAIARHLNGRLITMTVEDPLIAEASSLGSGTGWSPDDNRRELEDFSEHALEGESGAIAIEHEVAVGKPAEEILRMARIRACDLIVMSTHGLTGMRKLFFGSTTERVLRETAVPVLVTPAADPGHLAIEALGRLIQRVLVPVDLSGASGPQLRMAVAVAEALHVPLLLTHVIEPVRSPFTARLRMPRMESERRARADEALGHIVSTIDGSSRAEALVAYGDPAEEIAKVAQDRHAGLLVVGLHSSPVHGSRMGSVTYRVLCLSHTLVLAVPPAIADSAADEHRADRSAYTRT